MGKLRPSMSVEEFDGGYFYAAELKAFARQLGIAVGRRHKLELEVLIRDYLRTGIAPPAKPVPGRRSGDSRDTLAAETVVRIYVDDRRTKDFLRDLVHARAPSLKDKSGQWYWLNDWRRTQLQAGKRITYADLANRLLGLRRTEGRLPRIPAAAFQQFHHGFQGGLSQQGQEPRRGGGGLGVHQVRSRTEDLRGLRGRQVQPGVINVITARGGTEKTRSFRQLRLTVAITQGTANLLPSEAGSAYSPEGAVLMRYPLGSSIPARGYTLLGALAKGETV